MALLPVFAFFQGRDGRPTGMETADSLNLDRMHNSLLGALQRGVLGRFRYRRYLRYAAACAAEATYPSSANNTVNDDGTSSTST